MPPEYIQFSHAGVTRVLPFSAVAHSKYFTGMFEETVLNMTPNEPNNVPVYTFPDVYSSVVIQHVIDYLVFVHNNNRNPSHEELPELTDRRHIIELTEFALCFSL